MRPGKFLLLVFLLVFSSFGQLAAAQSFQTFGGFSSQGGFSMPFNGGGSFIAPSFFSMGIQCPQQVNGTCPNPTWPYEPIGGGMRSLALAGPQVDWALLETGDRVYNWSALDSTLAIAAANGADYMFVFGYTPAFYATVPTQNCNASPIGACSPPNDINADGTGTDQHVKDFWNDFFAHLATLPAASQAALKFIEVWNEPQGPSFYVGTYAQLARITVDMAAIIHAQNRGIVVASPCPSAGGTSISNYFQGYLTDPLNPPYASLDAIDFHTYRYFPGKIPLASDIPPVVQAVEAELLKLGFSPNAKPMMVTEGGWGVDTVTGFTNQGTVSDTTPNHMGFAAQTEILHASSGLARFYWYAWDNNGGQGMITLGIVEQSGIAYGEVFNWLAGATIVAPCTADINGTTQCGISRPPDYQGLIIWNATASTAFAVGSQFTQSRDLAAGVHLLSSTSITATYNPVLYENEYPPQSVKITSAAGTLPNGQTGFAYSQTISAVNFTGTLLWAVRSGNSTLPPGLTLNSSTGIISGTPTTIGTYNFIVGAWDTGALGTGTANSVALSIQITSGNPPLVITSGPPTPTGTVGTAYSFNGFTASGGVPPYTWALNSGTLPNGLAITTASNVGKLSGTPTVANTFNFTVKVTDSAATVTVSVTYTIVIAAAPALVITSGAPPPTGVVGTPYSFNGFTATGGVPPYTWALNSGAFPTSVSISTVSNVGVLSGTPTVANTFNFTVKVTDSNSTVTTSPTYTVVISNAPSLMITSGGPPATGTVGTPYSFNGFTASGGTPPYTWSVHSGALPTSVSLSTVANVGVLSGTPTVANTFNFSVRVTDNVAATADSPTFTVTISAMPTVGENAYCSAGDVASFGGPDGPSTLPQACIYTARAGSPSPGTVRLAVTAADLTADLAASACGDVVELTAGNVYSGTFTIPNPGACDSAHWITIRTHNWLTAGPAEGTRVSPCWAGVTSLPGRPPFNCVLSTNRMGQIITPNVNAPLKLAAGANHIRIQGIEVTRFTPQVNASVSVLIDRTNCTAGSPCNHIILDQDWMHGTTNDETTRVMSRDNISFWAAVNGFYSDFHCMSISGTCGDSQVFSGGINNGTATVCADQAWKTYNNYMESAGETIENGGGFGMTTPCDGEDRSNWMFKPLTWDPADPSYIPPVNAQGSHPWIVKNHWEAKNANRWLIEGNVLQNVWGGFTQVGAAVLFTPKSQANNGLPMASISSTTTVATVVITGSNIGEVAPGTVVLLFGLTATGTTQFNGTFTVATVNAGAKSFTFNGAFTTTALTTLTGNCSTGPCVAVPGECPVCFVNNLTFRYNYISTAAQPFQIGNVGSSPCSTNCYGANGGVYSIHDNVGDNFGFSSNNSVPVDMWQGATDPPSPSNFYLHDVSGIHNTFVYAAVTSAGTWPLALMNFDGPLGAVLTNLTMEDSILASGQFGINGAYSGSSRCAFGHSITNGASWLASCWSGTVIWDYNCVIGGAVNVSWSWPGTHNKFPATYSAALFTNYNNGLGGDYHLQAGSACHNAAHDGTDMGANVSTVNSFIAGVNTF